MKRPFSRGRARTRSLGKGHTALAPCVKSRDAGPAPPQTPWELDLAVEHLWLNSCQLWLNSSCPHSFPKKKGLTGEAALSQPTPQPSREHINTSRRARQGALLLHRVANAVLIASSGESARAGAGVPPEKTAGGRERNQPHTGVHEFPWLKNEFGGFWI